MQFFLQILFTDFFYFGIEGLPYSAATALPSLRWITSDPAAGHLRIVRGFGCAIFILPGTTKQTHAFGIRLEAFSVGHSSAKQP